MSVILVWNNVDCQGSDTSGAELRRRSPTYGVEPVVRTLDKPVLSIADTCAYLDMSRDKVMELIKEEGLPAIQFQRLWRIYKTALDEWLLERTRRATAERSNHAKETTRRNLINGIERKDAAK